MKIGIALAILIAGVILLLFGFSASNSLGSEISEFFTGSPTNRAIWMMIGGIVLLVIGVAMLATQSSRRAV